MGNTETRIGTESPGTTGKLKWPAPKAVPTPCRVAEEAELRARRALPAAQPVNPRVLHANFVTRAQATCPAPLDARPLLLLVWAQRTHAESCAAAAAAQQERVHAQLRASAAFLARSTAALSAHAATVRTLTGALGGVAAAAGTVRDTAIRAAYALDAAERLDRVMALVESEIELEHPGLLASIPDPPPSPDPVDPVDALANIRLSNHPLNAPIAFM